MNINDKIIEFIDLLKRRPLMILSNEVDYNTLRTYLEGYVDGMGHLLNKNIRLNISHWFQKKVNQKASVYWTSHILNYYKNKTEEELKLILLQTTEDYFTENPDWYKNEENGEIIN